MKDTFGRELKVGDYIVVSRYNELYVGLVKTIFDDRLHYYICVRINGQIQPNMDTMYKTKYAIRVSHSSFV